MGFQEIKHGVEEEEEADPTEIWVIAGISLRAPLKPVKTSTSTKPTSTTTNDVDDDGLEEEEEEEEEDTPVRRPLPEGTVISCPPAPKKPKPPVGCRLEGVEFFSVPDDLRAVFVLRHGEKNIKVRKEDIKLV